MDDAEKQKHKTALVYDARGKGGGYVAPTITGDNQSRITDYTAIVVQLHESLHRKPIRELPENGEEQ